MDGGDDGDDDNGDSSGDDTDDEDEDEEEEGEEEHLAPADSAIVLPTDDLVSPHEGTKPVIPPPSTNTTTTEARITEDTTCLNFTRNHEELKSNTSYPEDIYTSGREIIFKCVKPTSNWIKRVYMLSLRERMEVDLEARLMGGSLVLNRSLDTLYGDYIKLNDLNVPLELWRNQVDDLMPTIKEGFEFVPTNFFPNLPINVMSKTFYNSIMKDKIEFRGRNELGNFANVPVFIGNFYVITDFTFLEDMDPYLDKGIGKVVVGEPFCEVSCVETRRFDEIITIYDEEDSVTYQMVQSNPWFKHLSNEQCNKIPPLLKVSKHDKINDENSKRPRTLGDYSRPIHKGHQNAIELPEGAKVSPLRSDTIWLVQYGYAFQGLMSEDPIQHLKDLLIIIDSIDINGATRDTTRLCLFCFSLRNQAIKWLDCLLAGSISTWDDLTTRFLTQFFPPGRTTKLQKDILMFQQHPDESLYDVWTRFKDLLQRVHHHGGRLRKLSLEEAWKTIEDLAQYEEKEWNEQTFSKKRSHDYIDATLTQELESMDCRLESLMRNKVLLENTRDLGSFREETDKTTDLHQNPFKIMLTERGDDVTSIKRCHHDLRSVGVSIFVTLSEHKRPKGTLKDSMSRD
uniref:Zinc finger, CCHC-type n=1 Tax=Tanacetum cinerariifolium TaxID=118510 RepID=A0A6L2JED2_TANCI|nr:zinc finger, CCHC-type [Tanacetum cinerariifolium]